MRSGAQSVQKTFFTLQSVQTCLHPQNKIYSGSLILISQVVIHLIFMNSLQVKLWKIPDGGLTETLSKPDVCLPAASVSSPTLFSTF